MPIIFIGVIFMLKYEKLSQHPHRFLSFTGIKREQFDSLYEKVQSDYEDFERQRLDRPDRLRAIGGGRKFRLDLRDRILMVLVYYRLYITYALCGYLFDLDESNVCRNIQMLEPLIQRYLPLPEKVCSIDNMHKRISTIDELERTYPGLLAIVDTTEQHIPRPKDKDQQKRFYSGRKKCYSVKSQIVINAKGVITHTITGVEGRKHDYQILKESHLMEKIPKEVVTHSDSGYQGLQKDYPDRMCILPKRASKNNPLTEQDKKRNKTLASIRVIIEHVISRLKKFRILSGVYRNARDRYKTIFSTIAGIINLRTMDRMAFQS